MFSTIYRKRLTRSSLYLATAPVCLWQHVLRKSRLGQDHLPRVMPPALRPIEARISRFMKALIQSINSTTTNNDKDDSNSVPNNALNVISKLDWTQLVVILNACKLILFGIFLVYK